MFLIDKCQMMWKDSAFEIGNVEGNEQVVALQLFIVSSSHLAALFSSQFSFSFVVVEDY